MPAKGEPVLKHVDRQGRVVLPPIVREALRLGEDDWVAFQVEKEGKVVLRKATVTLS